MNESRLQELIAKGIELEIEGLEKKVSKARDYIRKINNNEPMVCKLSQRELQDIVNNTLSEIQTLRRERDDIHWAFLMEDITITIKEEPVELEEIEE